MNNLNKLTIKALFEYFDSLCDYEVSRKNPNYFQKSIPDMEHKLAFEVLEDDREELYWYIVIKITRFDSPTDSVILRWTGDYDSWNGVEWYSVPEMVIEKSETRVVTWYESVNNEEPKST